MSQVKAFVLERQTNEWLSKSSAFTKGGGQPSTFLIFEIQDKFFPQEKYASSDIEQRNFLSFDNVTSIQALHQPTPMVHTI